MSNAMRAAVQEVPAAEGSAASVPCCGMNGWQSRWLWQRRRTTPHEDRSLPQSSGRRGSTRCTTRPPRRERPGILAEPGPRRSDRSLRRSAGDSHPTLGLPVLAEVSGDALDASSAKATAVEGGGGGVGEQADEEEKEEEEEEETS